MEKSPEDIKNETKTSLTFFEARRIFNKEWPLYDEGKVTQVLEHQLKFAGGFCADMKVIDLDTPSNIRLNFEKLLKFLNGEPRIKSPITSIDRFVIPNMGVLRSTDQVKKLVENFLNALGSSDRPVMVATLILPCDEVFTQFHKGDLDWISQFNDDHGVKKIEIKVVNRVRPIESFNEFKDQFCGKDRFADYKSSDFLKSSMKRSAPQPKDNFKKRRITADDIQCNNISKDRLPSTSILNKCWQIDRLHKQITGKGVTIAFVDSGINISHEAFAGRIVAVNDITGDGTIDLTTDSFGHGTMCAFVACGASFKASGGMRVPAGVAPGAKIIMYRVTNDSGRAHSDAVTKALQQCVEDKERHSIDIVLLPYGLDHHDLDQANAILDLIRKDVLVVTASGNNGRKNDVSYPGRLGFTICIGSHGIDYHTKNYTSKGHALDYTAPGECLAGACAKHPTAFTIEQGTSYAAASVAGLLALIIEYVSLKKVAPRITREPSLNKLVHNQFAMKKVLRSISRYCTKHDEDNGYGHLDPNEIFSKKKKDLENLFYKDILDDKSKSFF